MMLTLLEEFRQARAKRAAETPTLGGCLWNGCMVKSGTMASSELLRSCCSISSKCRNTAEEPGRVAVSRS